MNEASYPIEDVTPSRIGRVIKFAIETDFQIEVFDDLDEQAILHKFLNGDYEHIEKQQGNSRLSDSGIRIEDVHYYDGGLNKEDMK